MIVGVLQARTASERLPSKVLLPLAGAPMLARQIERIQRARRIDRLVLATSTEPSDDPIASLADELGIELFRGSLEDVLDRVYQAARGHSPSHVVRLTADCPLADWSLIDRLIAFAVEGDFDYASNAVRPTWPDGLDAEVVRFEALETAWREASSPVDREHVMTFIRARPERFRIGSFENDVDLSGMRWTVDQPEDYEFVSRVYDALYPANAAFQTADVLDLLEREPQLLAINSGFRRNEGLARSIKRHAGNGLG